MDLRLRDRGLRLLCTPESRLSRLGPEEAAPPPDRLDQALLRDVWRDRIAGGDLTTTSTSMLGALITAPALMSRCHGGARPIAQVSA